MEILASAIRHPRSYWNTKWGLLTALIDYLINFTSFLRPLQNVFLSALKFSISRQNVVLSEKER